MLKIAIRRDIVLQMELKLPQLASWDEVLFSQGTPELSKVFFFI
jgi:hypothetical protein